MSRRAVAAMIMVGDKFDSERNVQFSPKLGGAEGKKMPVGNMAQRSASEKEGEDVA